VQAEGGDVPTFSGTVRAPIDLVVTEPSVDANGTFYLERGLALELAWSGGGEGAVVSFIGSHFDNSGFSAVRCRFDATALGASVPATALDLFPPETRFSLSISGQSTAKQGPFEVTLSARGNVLDESGELYPGVALARD
jgi:hypothetical protein